MHFKTPIYSQVYYNALGALISYLVHVQKQDKNIELQGMMINSCFRYLREGRKKRE